MAPCMRCMPQSEIYAPRQTLLIGNFEILNLKRDRRTDKPCSDIFLPSRIKKISQCGGKGRTNRYARVPPCKTQYWNCHNMI